ncbi:MAG: patatin-like phospholipase family protein [Planctomycetes bacterium]|nr:patatin-like phospholipase family protein [Planctomycetota bacterium]
MTRIALALGGGGARAAYQVGVLQALAQAGGDVPFKIVTGVSAGAINAAHLASHGPPLAGSIEALTEHWTHLTVDRVFESGAGGLFWNVLKYGTRLLTGGRLKTDRPAGMVDTEPLRKFLEDALPHRDGRLIGVEDRLERGGIDAVGITAIDYGTGRSVTWVEGAEQFPDLWERRNRIGVHAKLTIDHILASAALPLLFPAVRVGASWFGDGGVRLTAPLSPALHLGADRILVISPRYNRSFTEASQSDIDGPPPTAQILGVLFHATLIDNLDYDANILERITHLVERIPPSERGPFRPVRVLTIRPSVDLAKIATEFEPQLPRAFRFLERGLGTQQTRSADFLSYLMFQENYIRALIELGRRDTQRDLHEILDFIQA